RVADRERPDDGAIGAPALAGVEAETEERGPEDPHAQVEPERELDGAAIEVRRGGGVREDGQDQAGHDGVEDAEPQEPERAIELGPIDEVQPPSPLLGGGPLLLRYRSHDAADYPKESRL